MIRAYLQIRGAATPRWIEGGERLAFTTAITGLPQLWAVPAGGGWPEQLTFGAERVAGVLADAGATALAFERDRGGDERHRLHLALPERPLVADVDAIHRLGAFAPDGAALAYTHTARNGVDFDLAVVDLATGERRDLAEPGGWSAALDWGDAGILVARMRSNVDDDLLLVDPRTGATVPLTAEAGGVSHLPAVLLPDGAVLCGCDRDADFRRPVILRDGALEPLGPDGADVEAVAVHGERRAWVLNEDGRSRLVLDGRTVEGLPPGVYGGLAFAPDGRRLALHVAQPADTTDVWTVDVDRSPRRVTRSSLGGVAPERLVAPVHERLRSFDGREVPYLRYGEPGRPALVWVHGGPESQERPTLNPVIQYLAGTGLTVAAPNIRGSTGYGRAYAALDDGPRRPDAIRDLAELGRALGAGAGVPVGIMGGSYGGYAVLAAITEYPDLWRAAVDVVGIANLVTFLERTGSYRRALREAEYGSLEHDRALLERLSPIHRVDRIRAPLMVVHGANDPRVPVSEAEQIVAALRDRGATVDYLRYDDEGHGLVRLANRIEAYTAVATFLRRHLLDATDGGRDQV